MRVHFGHCIGCDQPIRPPYLSFTVALSKAPDGGTVTSFCGNCAATLTAVDLHRLVSEEEGD